LEGCRRQGARVLTQLLSTNHMLLERVCVGRVAARRGAVQAHRRRLLRGGVPTCTSCAVVAPPPSCPAPATAPWLPAACATVAEVRKRGDEFWAEFEFYLSVRPLGGWPAWVSCGARLPGPRSMARRQQQHQQRQQQHQQWQRRGRQQWRRRRRQQQLPAAGVHPSAQSPPLSAPPTPTHATPLRT
jgi:hypothetical protein